jgi:dipeptidyl aminopeptidase/acylaminoacyl peptidase
MPRNLKVEDLYDILSPSDPQLSPDGSRIAFVVSKPDKDEDAYHTAIWVVSTEGNARQFTAGPADSAPRWNPTGCELAFVAKRGDDPPQVYLLPSDGGEARRLTNLPLGAGDMRWSPQGDRLLVIATVDLDQDAPEHAPRVIERSGYKADGAGWIGSKRRHLFVVSREGGEPIQLTSGEMSVGAASWSPDGKRIAYLQGTERPERDLEPESAVWVINAGGGKAKRVTPDGWVASSVTWSADGRTLLITGSPELRVGHSQLYTVLAAGGNPEPATEIDRNVMVGFPGYPGARPVWLPDGRILFCVRERGRVHVLCTDVGAPPVPIVSDETMVVSGMDARDGRIAFVAGSQESPGEIYVTDLNGGKHRRLTFLFSGALPNVRMRRPENRTFTAPDGTAIEGWLVKGTGKGPRPTLLDIHGGPHNAWGPTLDGVHLYHQTLAAAGWNILYINPRGSDGYGENFFRAVSGAWGLSDEADFTSAVQALIDEGIADPARLVVTGYSYGGFMSAWLSARTDLFAAAIPGGLVSDLTSVGGTSDGGIGMRKREIGDNVIQSSPLSYVEQVTAPTLIYHGERDDRCDLGQAEEWFGALRARKVPVELVVYPGGSHLLILNGRPSHRVDFNRRVHDWAVTHTK